MPAIVGQRRPLGVVEEPRLQNHCLKAIRESRFVLLNAFKAAFAVEYLERERKGNPLCLIISFVSAE